MLYNTSIYDHKFIAEKLKERNFLYGKELCSVLNCNERTIIRWRRAREKGENVGIPFSRIEKKYIYFIKDINEYFKGNLISQRNEVIF